MTSFTELKFNPDRIGSMVADKQAALKANKGLSDLLGFALGVVSRRLAKDPGRYLDYGPYWWALKSALNANGYSYGNESDPVVSAEYCGRSDVETVVMADQFRTEFLEASQVGTTRFRLSEEADDYVLVDVDMHMRMAVA